MRLPNYFVALCFLAPSFAAAQSAFLTNPDIVWAAEIEYDWKVDFTNVWEEYYEGIGTNAVAAFPLCWHPLACCWILTILLGNTVVPVCCIIGGQGD